MYENDVYNFDYVIVEYFDVFICIKNIVNIFIWKFNFEVWIILIMGCLCFLWYFNIVKFKVNLNENI